MNNFEPYLPILKHALEAVDSWRSAYGSIPGSDQHLLNEQIEQIQLIANQLAERLEGNYPFHHPSYAGQMLKPPHPIAWLAYSLAMTINPNNHALDGGPPTSEMEKEVIQNMVSMIGYDSNALGHLTSGGTIANLEALFIAREIHPDKAIAATSNAHYTHQRMCRVLNCDFITIPVDHLGYPDLSFIKAHAHKIGTLVVTMGTTGMGFVEPLEDLLEVAQANDLRVHADAAYGGFFTLISDQLPSKKHWSHFPQCDSVVIDPHKHGLQPYGCGSVIYKDASVGTYFKHDSPYTYFTSDDLHLGEISLECSRAGASAAAFWATLQLLPLSPSGLGRILSSAVNAAQSFASLIKNQHNWTLCTEPDLDIAVYFKEPKQKSIRSLNQLSEHIFRKGMELDTEGFHLSLYKIPSELFCKHFPEYEANAEYTTVLRSVFMKEEHESFVEELFRRLQSV